MAERRIILMDGDRELILPVTPRIYTVEKGIAVEVVNIHEFGDAIFAGQRTRPPIKIDFMLPANTYSFAKSSDPEPYLTQLEEWILNKKRLRLIVGGTNINIPVLVHTLVKGERDGTNDVYCTMTLREYPMLKATRVQETPAENKPREEPPPSPAPAVTVYTIVRGDTLSALSRRFYGDGTAKTYKRLAAYNKIPNPNLIFTGATIRIPQPLP